MSNNFFRCGRCAAARVALSATILASISAPASAVEVTVPLTKQAWIAEAYDKIPPNAVRFDDNVLTVSVRRSAGPLLHKLDAPLVVSGISAKARVKGRKATESGSFDEDSVLRVGLVALGDRKLSGPARWFAAAWAKRLFALAPSGSGIDKIYFFNVTDRADLAGKSRIHPKSDLISETAAAILQKDGTVDFSRELAVPLKTAAVWLSIDGDDSKSEYETAILDLKLRTP